MPAKKRTAVGGRKVTAKPKKKGAPRQMAARPPAATSGAITAAPFPFLFKNHGPLMLESFTKGTTVYIGFERAPTPDELRAIIAACPAPVRGDTACTDTLFATSPPGDVFDWAMVEHYATKAEVAQSQAEGWATFGQETADRFSADVEKWILGVHARVPIVFVIGPCEAPGDDPWDTWTCERLADRLVAFVEDFAARHPRLPEESDYAGDEYDVRKISRGTLACMLQEFDGHGLRIGRDLVPRVAKLRKAFPI